MTDVHGYDVLSIPIVFHYSVGFDIAYPRMEAMREPKGRDKQDCLDPRFFVVLSNEKQKKEYYGTDTLSRMRPNG